MKTGVAPAIPSIGVPSFCDESAERFVNGRCGDPYPQIHDRSGAADNSTKLATNLVSHSASSFPAGLILSGKGSTNLGGKDALRWHRRASCLRSIAQLRSVKSSMNAVAVVGPPH